MKRFLILLIAVMTINCTAMAAENVEIYIDDELLECEVTPVNIDGRVLVPMRAIFEALGMQVFWNGNDRSVWAERGDEFICIPIDSTEIGTGVKNSDGADVWVDTIQVDVPARIIDDRTFVPVRAVSETLGSRVSWDGDRNRVIIDSRRNEKGIVYYTSLSDYGKLYSVGKNGLLRNKISDKTVYNLKMYDGYVYYQDKEDNYIYKANDEEGETAVVRKTSDMLAVEDGYLYYQETDGRKKNYGVLYRIGLSDGEIERLTDNPVQYPLKYRDYIYFNLDNDNKMYAVTKDGTEVITIDTGDEPVLRPFNCVFYGDYILMEDGVWYGNIIRMDLNGENAAPISRSNSLIFKNQEVTNQVLYLNPEQGQDIYSVNLDGSDLHLVHKGDPSWLDIELLAKWDNMIYYRHPMRKEIYRVNLDGSNETYVGYADDMKIIDGRMFTSYNGLYADELYADKSVKIYDRAVKDFKVMGEDIYVLDGASSKLYITDLDGNKSAVTSDGTGEWVTE